MRNIDGSRNKGPLSDSIIIAVAKLVDDAQSDKREPSHSDIEYQINLAQLQSGDPRAAGQMVGKAKRVRGTLMWAMQNAPEQGELLVANLISMVKGYGGFRTESPNYCGSDCIISASEAFRAEGYELTPDGELIPLALQNLAGMELTKALKSYIRRAQRGIGDAALGTGKDLLEAVAAHVLRERYGSYAVRDNFPTLLGQAFITSGLATSQDKPDPGESPQKRIERAIFEVGLAINQLRNKEGTGHGRPWLPSVSESEARIAVELMGIIAERLLLACEGER
jgi:hypothetical protein